MEWIWKLDYYILKGIQEYIRTDFMTSFWKFLSFLGDKGWIWIALALFLLVNKKTRRMGTAMIIALLAGLLIANAGLKNIFCRMRPYDAHADLILIGKKLSDYSFPSGHTTASFAAAFLCEKIMERRKWIPWMILALGIAFSRLYLGFHYPTDILGGVMIGYLAAGIGVIWYRGYLRQKDYRGNRK